MSCDARDWAWSLSDLAPSSRLLLLALAEHVHEGVTCFPGQARLAAMCGVSDRQVRNLLRELQGRGLIVVEHRPGQGGGRKPNVYRLEMGIRQPVSVCHEQQPETDLRNAISGYPGATGSPAQGNRNLPSAWPGGQPELHLRKPVSACPEATGNTAQGKRSSVSAEPEERTVRNTPPNPPTGGTVTPWHDDAESATRTARETRLPAVAAIGATPPGPPPSADTASEDGDQRHGEGERAPASATPAVQPRNVVTLERSAARDGSDSCAAEARRGTGPPIGRQGSEGRTHTRRGKRNGEDLRLAEKDYTLGATRDEDLPDWASRWRERADVAE